MKKITISLFAAIVLFALSCSDNGKGEAVTYDPQELDAVEAESLSLVSLNDSFIFSRPEQIGFVADTLIIIHDNVGRDGISHIFAGDGRHVKSFAKIGKGRGELLDPVAFFVGEGGRSIYYFDWKTKNTVKYPLQAVLDGKVADASVIKFVSPFEKMKYGFRKVYHFDDSTYLGFGPDESSRIVLVKGNKAQDVYTTYPLVDENEENKWSIWTNMAKVGISPDRKHIVVGAAIGSMFEVFSVADGKINRDVFKAFYKPVYRLAQGAVPACVVSTKGTIWGFTALYCANESFWGVMGGEKYSHRDVIYEFSYSGELLNKYKVNGQVETLAVNSDGKLYLVMADEGKEPHLMMADMNKVKRRKP